MKTIYKTLIAGAALTCASGAVLAQSTPSNQPQNLTNTDYSDLNGDGAIDRSEVRAGSQLEKRFATRDKNGDGRLTMDEYKVVQRGDTTPNNLPNSAGGNNMGSSSSNLGMGANQGSSGAQGSGSNTNSPSGPNGFSMGGGNDRNNGSVRRGGAQSGGQQDSGAGQTTGGNSSGADGTSGNHGG